VARGSRAVEHAAVFDHGQLLTLDMSLTLYMTLALSGFLLAQRPSREPGARGRRGCCSPGRQRAGVLTRARGSCDSRACVDSVRVHSRDYGPWRRLRLGSGLPLFLAITVPWHWLAARRLPDFLDFFSCASTLARY